ncbi:McrB family protein [Prevotella disiens]|uniref:McrB family protein n=1 Tax=Prevotella disiens TaxID=28130 RepID=UPI0024306723|nr:AAA family ATPase [Prevotella disiens]
MEKIEIIQTGEVASCDIGVSKEEWLKLLKDSAMPIYYKEALIKVFYAPNHRGSCTSICNELGGDPQSLNFDIANCGEYVQKRLGRFQIIRPNGKPCYWLVPMAEGKDLPRGSEGTFEWQLRSELTEAIKEYLYWYLVECYKKLRKDIRIDDEKWNEAYKWQLVTECQGKDFISIVNKVRVTNLIYTPLVSPTLDYVINNHRKEFEKAVQSLTDGQVLLDKRIQDFSATMQEIADDPNNDKQNLYANDERTASAILTCIDPNTYTTYKYGLYKTVCQYLNMPPKKPGKCYSHFMELIKPLLHIVENDNELHDLVAPSIENYVKSDLLLAQDVLWSLFVSFPKQLGFLHSLLWRARYWCVGHIYNDEESQRSRFVKEGVWEAWINDTAVGQRQLKLAKKIKKGDVVIIKSSFTKGTNHDIPCVRIFAIGEVTNEEGSIRKEDTSTNVSYKVNYFWQGQIDFDGSKYGRYRRIIDECTDKEIINHINSVRNAEPTRKYAKYIELLEQNKNLVLTGAPGTGKTFMAKAIAKEMGCSDDEIAFVQFHPSYDYTDFVEGLRPVRDSDNFGFELRNGVFKDFCAKALQNFKDSEKSIERLQKESSVREILEDFIEEAIYNETVFETSGTKNSFSIVENNERNITVEVPANEKTRLVKLSKAELIDLMENEKPVTSGKDIQEHFHRKHRTQQDSYIFVLYNIIKKQAAKKPSVEVSKVDTKNYVFIIDEINRGDISKIFGELFFAIDSGYRGERGKVNTQYQNIIEDGDPFKDGFFVPENVYIIGTMNDIDRSVENMDFAMRRRFSWVEVTPNDTESILDKLSCVEEAKETMERLNKAIEETEGLGAAYMIGPAYFRKLGENGGDFDKLWKMNIEPLLREYLRGFRKTGEIMNQLSMAYFGKKEEEHSNTPALTDEN